MEKMAKIIGKWVDIFLNSRNYFVIIRPWFGLGEQVCMTAAINTVAHTYKSSKIIVMTDFPDVFVHNPKVHRIIDMREWPWKAQKLLLFLVKKFSCKRVKIFAFSNPHKKFEDYMRETKSTEHLTVLCMKHFGLPTETACSIKPEIFFSDMEEKKFSEKFKFLKSYCIIHPSGISSYTANKDWSFEKMQDVVNQMQDDIFWVQAGLLEEPVLKNVLDLRGKTTLRELFYLVGRAQCVVSTEGLYNHIAAAFNVPSIVVFSGFLPVEVAKYPNTIAVTNKTQATCFPCWLKTPCPLPSRMCIAQITVEMVVEQLRLTLKQNSKKLTHVT